MRSLPVTVLVVEDEALIGLAIADELEDQGFVVFSASSADDAIKLIERHPEIAVVFTDIDMPGTMDGIKLAAFVRDRWPPIKIIVTSGRVNPKGSLAEDIPFLAKPYDHATVVGTIRGLMSL
ncbi:MULTISPECIES: response regulator [unclassified Rhizobium]|jgi:CheY-like chemotaxis protein|uniref:response regulator n=1 Tax=unclassified Rhizobium TaxID=2613769 RepID=UPI000647553A|nr:MULTISPECIES: response regulator [unclassified Rhizobium]OJY63236.1 MAG: chemotaxis protein CheY [Rhizobium sp. 60-20]RKD50360.1 response regulator receiver domain-containing protein [Rhizobium sp. WW_1]